MISEICMYLKNWFNKGQLKYIGSFTISNNVITFAGGEMTIQNGQYFRIVGSTFNDGVYKYGEENTYIDESFRGSVWLMAVPPDFLALLAEIEAWQTKNGGVDSEMMSPFQSESFGGYSYTKASGGGSSSSSSLAPSWQNAFGARLRRYKKI